jgi:hypothetical protein
VIGLGNVIGTCLDPDYGEDYIYRMTSTDSCRLVGMEQG